MADKNVILNDDSDGSNIYPKTFDYNVYREDGTTLDKSVVHTTGNEIIAGQKTFNGDIIVNGNLYIN